MDEIELSTSLSSTEITRNAHAAADSEHFAFSLSGYSGDRPFLIKETDSGFRVQKRRYHRNGFHPYLFAKIEPTAMGSRVQARIGMHPVTRMFMVVWFAFGAIIESIVMGSLVIGVAHGQNASSELLWLLHPVALLGGGYAVLRLGQYLCRGEPEELRAWLRNVLQSEHGDHISESRAV